MSNAQEELVESSIKTEFYHDYRFPIVVLMFSLLGIGGGLGFFIFLQYIDKPEPMYFILNQRGQLIQEAPLDAKGIEENVLLNWVIEAGITANSYNYTTLDSTFKKLAPYFSNQGFEDYKESLKYRNYILEVINQKMVVSSVARRAPTVIKEGVDKDTYTWIIKLPLTIKYQNVDFSTSKQFDLDILIKRVPARVNAMGVRIERYFLKDMNPEISGLTAR